MMPHLTMGLSSNAKHLERQRTKPCVSCPFFHSSIITFLLFLTGFSSGEEHIENPLSVMNAGFNSCSWRLARILIISTARLRLPSALKNERWMKPSQNDSTPETVCGTASCDTADFVSAEIRHVHFQPFTAFTRRSTLRRWYSSDEESNEYGVIESM